MYRLAEKFLPTREIPFVSRMVGLDYKRRPMDLGSVYRAHRRYTWLSDITVSGIKATASIQGSIPDPFFQGSCQGTWYSYQAHCSRYNPFCIVLIERPK